MSSPISECTSFPHERKIIFTQRTLASGSAVDYLLVPDDD